MSGTLKRGLFHIVSGISIPVAALFLPRTALVGSVGATIVESMPLPIKDNLTMPLFAGLVMTVMQL